MFYYNTFTLIVILDKFGIFGISCTIDFISGIDSRMKLNSYVCLYNSIINKINFIKSIPSDIK